MLVWVIRSSLFTNNFSIDGRACLVTINTLYMYSHHRHWPLFSLSLSESLVRATPVRPDILVLVEAIQNYISLPGVTIGSPRVTVEHGLHCTAFRTASVPAARDSSATDGTDAGQCCATTRSAVHVLPSEHTQRAARSHFYGIMILYSFFVQLLIL